MSRESIAAVGETVVRFFAALDGGAFETLADLMAPDGVWHRQGKALAGREAILKAMAERGPDVRTAHLVTNLLVEPDADAATARFIMTAFRHDGALAADAPAPLAGPFSIGFYTCRCVRHDGHWRIAEMRGNTRFKR